MQEKSSKIPLCVLIVAGIILSGIVVSANYTVQFNIANTPLTYGALAHPFSFLLLDVLSERYSKKEVMKVIGIGVLFAFFPSYLMATPQIAIASILAFCISQPLDITFFYIFKRYFPKLWWLRNGISTIMAQFFDTFIFFTLAFWGTKELSISLQMALADYFIKAAIGLANTPLFYLFAIRAKLFWQKFS